MSASGKARDISLQVVQYVRRRVQYTDSGISAGVKIGRLPSRAYITQIDLHTVSAFNSATSDTLQLGTTASGTDVLAATSVHATGLTHGTSAAGLGLAVTASGEVDLYAKWVGTGAAPSAGDVTVVIAFIADHDG